ncbi:MAG: hypothetical protein H6624_03320 [Bdellovibrionaceae bacterium]|nr:hypothetical protein [Bdellovibrionales bacterium]MCB9083345.1 hypothetical protein [Pseudobdellovibrionaceae bacterium]
MQTTQSSPDVVVRLFQLLSIVLAIYMAQSVFVSFVNDFSDSIRIESAGRLPGPNYIPLKRYSQDGSNRHSMNRYPAGLLD